MSHPGFRAAASAAAIAATLALSGTAMAQEAGQPRGEIFVTAKDPGDDLEHIPAAVTNVLENELPERQVDDLSALSYAFPNVSLDAIGTFKGVANFSIRGLGINSSIPSIDPAVGLFVDGVYQGINAGTVFDLLDVSQITVLNGPQGVAFGRNTTGGAVLLKTGDPSWEWEGHAKVGYESPVDQGRGTGLLRASGVVSGPLSDAVAIRLAALHSDDGGYFENSFDGSNFGAAKTTILRGGLALRPGEKLSLTIKGEWNKSDGDGAPTHNNGQHARDNFEISIDEPGFYHSKGGSVTARTEYELGAGRLTDIFGWRSYDLATRNDIDSSPTKIFHSDTRTRQEQWSNELYYAADFGPLDLTAGGYIFHQDIGYDEARDLATDAFGGGRQQQDVYGLYAQADYALSDAWSASLGLRWSREEKQAQVTYVRPRAACSAIDATCPVSGENVPGENNGFTDNRAWEGLSPRVALSFQPSETSILYASWTRGFRSGGYNLRITQPGAFEQVAGELGSYAFDEEEVGTFELGAKWQKADGTAWINAELFRTGVGNLQREINVPSLSSGLAQSVYNTADAEILGGEMTAFVLPAPGFTLTANLGYTDADYRKVFFDINSDGVVDAADLALELPRAPKWSWGGSASYETALGQLGTVAASLFFQHRSAFAYTDNNWGFNSASDRLDASLALKMARSAVTVTLFGRNLLDEVQFGGDTQLPFAGGAYSDGTNLPFDPHPAAGTFSPLNKGRVLGVELAEDF